MIAPIDLNYCIMHCLNFLNPQLQVGVGVWNAICEIHILIFTIELVLKREGKVSIGILVNRRLSVFTFESFLKRYILSLLLPFITRWTICVHLHPYIIWKLAPRKIDQIHFNSLLMIKIGNLVKKPTGVSFGITVYSHK